jgi:hypothetical protein
MLKGAYGSLAPNGGKVFQKLIQGLAALQVLQESLERDASSAKNRGSPENVGVPDDHFVA